ncbi:MAG TPA: aldo/keto reductase [Casimicrobiaceae bacterium]|jgi:diketogulonate reductase-like aldo/keto reductase|nr:aldo/keto reductase [Casimicrobiaceae bacterium]
MPSIRTVAFADGTRVPALGLGTWRMGERPGSRDAEVAALRRGFDHGLTLVDTAEMYADGGSEEVVGRAIAGRRDEIFVVSKAYPHHAGRRSAIAACEKSLARLRIDRLDLYLLHWRGDIPLAETVEAFDRLKRDGKIARWGVSNFDVDDLDELAALDGGSACAANQVLYHLGERGIERGALPRCRAWPMPVMAYSPFDEGRLLSNAALARVAREAGTSAATLALAWIVSHDGVMAIPKAATLAHVDAIVAAVGFKLSDVVVRALDRAFPPPKRRTPLAMI